MTKAAKQQKPQLTGPTMAEIEAATKEFAEARNALAGTVSGLLDEIAQVKGKYRHRLLAQLAAVKLARGDVRVLVERHPELFEKPRSVVFHGVKVGYRKGVGRLVYESAERVISLIRKHFSGKALEVLINVKESPNKEAIASLDVDQLKKIGCTVEGTSDVVEIRALEGDVEKAIDALLGEEAA